LVTIWDSSLKEILSQLCCFGPIRKDWDLVEFTKNFSSPSCLYAWPKHIFLVQQQSNYYLEYLFMLKSSQETSGSQVWPDIRFQEQQKILSKSLKSYDCWYCCWWMVSLSIRTESALLLKDAFNLRFAASLAGLKRMTVSILTSWPRKS